MAPPLSHHDGAWGFRFRQSTRHEGVNEERRRKNLLPSPAAHQGEEEGGTMSLKTTLFCSFFFFFNMKRRRFRQKSAVSFNYGANILISKLVLNLSFVLLSSQNVILILRINSIASLLISIIAPIVGRLFHLSPCF